MDLNVCSACGAWSDSPDVLAAEAVVVCSQCGHRQGFQRLPLFALTGASGAGKSTAVADLGDGLADRVVVLEQDLLWIPELQDPAEEHRVFRCAWARLIAAIHQNGRPVLLSGSVVPGQLEACPQRPFLGEIHYLGLVCDDAELAARLRGRPAWREFSPARIDHMTGFNRWIKQHASLTTPPMTLLDTTHVGPDTTAASLRAWVESRL